MKIASVVERRLLVNYRVEPELAARLLPAPLRPRLVRDWAVAGICLIRLGKLRPRWAPAGLGLRSENAAHRFAVEWDTQAGARTGVYIPCRHTDSAVTTLAGGRLFPGVHGRAEFTVRETAGQLTIGFASWDGGTRVRVEARPTASFGPSELFADVAQAADFFAAPDGYSVGRDPRRLDSLSMRTGQWRIEPAEVTGVRSTFFDRLPPGTAHLDHALLMRDIPATWTALPPLRLSSAGQPVQP
ncbi:DUF2071 domain-containing protein [Crossiella sp. NPDC003009]